MLDNEVVSATLFFGADKLPDIMFVRVMSCNKDACWACQAALYNACGDERMVCVSITWFVSSHMLELSYSMKNQSVILVW